MKSMAEWLAVICAITLIPLSSVQSSRPVRSVAYPTQKGCWSEWFNRDSPSGSGDFELLRALRRERKPICPLPLEIRCRTSVTRQDARTTGENIVCNRYFGFCCENIRQYDRRCDFDYEVSFLCPCQDRCNKLCAPRYGSLNITTYRRLTAENVKASAQFSCSPGFKLVGPAKKSCRLQRRSNPYTIDWYPTSHPRCQSACPIPYPKNPDGGHVIVSNVNGYWTAKYSCKKGFTLVGSALSECVGYGPWSNEEPKCYLSALVMMNERDKCSFSNNLTESDSRCLFVNSDKNDLNWKQVNDEGKLRYRGIFISRLPGVPGDESNCSETKANSSKFRRNTSGGSTFTLVLTVFPFFIFEVKTATVLAGPFVHPKADFRSQASYVRFRLAAQSALLYAIGAHAICVPTGHIDTIGSTTDEFRYFSLITPKPPTGDYCLNFEDTIDPVDCKKFALFLQFSVQYVRGTTTLQLQVAPLGVGRRIHCNGATILNQA